MDIDKLLEAVDDLSADDLHRLQEHIAQRQRTLEHEAEDWRAALEAAAAEFRGDSSEDELREIFAAMNTKSTPSKKGL